MQYTFCFRRRSYIASNDCSIFSSDTTYYSYLKKTLYAGNVRVLAICILARYLSGLWLVAFLGTVYILLLVKSMRVVLTALIDREVTSLPSPQIHLVPHSQIQHSCHAAWRFAGQSIAQVHCRSGLSGWAIEAFANSRQCLWRHTGAVIPHDEIIGIQRDVYHATLWTVTHGVIQQISHQQT